MKCTLRHYLEENRLPRVTCRDQQKHLSDVMGRICVRLERLGCQEGIHGDAVRWGETLMRNTNTTNRLSSKLPKLHLLSIALIVALTGEFAHAQSATFQIGENARVLRASLQLEAGEINQAEYQQILVQETCHNPSSRLQDRNRPYLSVQNTSENDEEITSVVINMEEVGFEFGDGDMAGDGFDGLLSMLSAQSDDGVELTSAMYLGDMSEIQLDFTGLTEGLAAIFRLDIDEPDGMYMFPDYREAFQGANEGVGRTGALAKLSATFDTGASVNALFPRVGLVTNSGIPERYHSQSMTTTATSMVPEPTTLVLFVSALAGTAVMRRRAH